MTLAHRSSSEIEPASIPPVALRWFCLRAQPKHEHIAAAQLRKDAAIEVYLPRIRFRRATRQGSAWVTEALFPCYLFARFDWPASLRRVHHARGVREVVHFGDRWPTVPDEAVEQLRQQLGDKEVHQIPDALAGGETVRIVEGPFKDLLAIVNQPQPARQRVAVLLDFLGRQTCVEIDLEAVVKETNPRDGI